MHEQDELAVCYGEIKAAYDILKDLPRRFRQKTIGDRIYECNLEERKIANAIVNATIEVAKALDALSDYTWNTYVVEFPGKMAEDALYLAECDARKEFGKNLEILCTERSPTEYETEVLWRITMKLPEEKSDDDE